MRMYFLQLNQLSLELVPVMIESNIEPKKDRFIFVYSKMILKFHPYDTILWKSKEKQGVWKLKYVCEIICPTASLLQYRVIQSYVKINDFIHY